MTAAALLLLAVHTLGEAPVTYAQAYEKSQTGEVPLVVLVGADWCPYCRTMKQQVMPQLARSGALNSAAYVEVDSDRNGDLASQLLTGSGIPQLVMYKKGAGGWRRFVLAGAHSASEVEAFLRQGAPEAPAAEEE